MTSTIVIIQDIFFVVFLIQMIKLFSRTMGDGMTEEEKNMQALYAEMPYCVGSIAGASSVGVIIDRFGQKAANTYNGFFSTLCVIVLIIFNERDRFDWLAYFASAMVGFVD